MSELEEVKQRLEAEGWEVVLPCQQGRLLKNRRLKVNSVVTITYHRRGDWSLFAPSGLRFVSSVAEVVSAVGDLFYETLEEQL